MWAVLHFFHFVIYFVCSKVGRDIFSVQPDSADNFRLERKLNVTTYSADMKQADEDYLTSLVLEVRLLIRI